MAHDIFEGILGRTVIEEQTGKKYIVWNAVDTFITARNICFWNFADSSTHIEYMGVIGRGHAIK